MRTILRTLLHRTLNTSRDIPASVLVFMQIIPSFFHFLPELLHDVATTNKVFMGNTRLNAVVSMCIKERSSDSAVYSYTIVRFMMGSLKKNRQNQCSRTRDMGFIKHILMPYLK